MGAVTTTVPTALTPGVHFWRLAARTGMTVGTMWSPTWEFFVGYRSAPVNTSWGTVADFNGDGFADVVVGADVSNAAYVYLGSASGLSATPITITGPAGSAGFGYTVASVGDVNGDGFADLGVGATGSNTAYVYLGSASGLSATPVTISGLAGSYEAGYSVVSAGDGNGDGFADVVVGVALSGTAYVYPGSASGLSATPVTLTGLAGGYDLVIFVATSGDVNGDGFADVVVGAGGGDDTVYVYLGSTGGLSVTPITITGPPDPSLFGASVACAGDVNGDGYADVVVGSDGAAYVYLGSASGLSASPITLTGPAGSDFGWSVASADRVQEQPFS